MFTLGVAFTLTCRHLFSAWTSWVCLVQVATPKKTTPVEMVTTSEYFRASLGALDCGAAALLEKWCPRTYTEHLIDEASGEYVLTARCQQPKTRKSILMGIRTAFSNSGVQLSLQGRDLQLLTDEQYEKKLRLQS